MSDEMDEIWALYEDDGAQALDAMEEALDALESDPSDSMEQIGALFRAVHTFKGNSRVLGLGNVEAVAHIGEDLIGLLRDEGVPVDEDILDILVLTGDVLRGMLEETARTRNDVDPGPSEQLKNDLKAMYNRLSGNEDAEPAPEPVQVENEATDDVEEPVAEEPVAKKEAVEVTAAEPEVATDVAPETEPADEDVIEEAPAAAAPKAPAKPVFDMGLAGLLDQLDGGDGASFDDFEENDFGSADDAEEEEEAPAEVVADIPDEPEEEPAETLAEVTSGQVSASVLTMDPMYRTIFGDMVEKTISELTELHDGWSGEETAKSAKGKADGLSYAAEQLNLTEWVERLNAFIGKDAQDQADLSALLADLNALYQRDLGDGAEAEEAAEPEALTEPEPPVVEEEPVAEAPAPVEEAPVEKAPAASEKKEAPKPAAAPKKAAKPAKAAEAKPTTAESSRLFFVELEKLYPELAKVSMGVEMDAQDPEERAALFEKIIGLAKPLDYVRVVDAANNLWQAEKGNAYRSAELTFYEELVIVEKTLPSEWFEDGLMSPSKLLGIWSTDTIFETLNSLRQGLESRTKAANGQWFPAFENLMRRVYFASSYYQVEAASQLSMALIDLFQRTRADQVDPDVILIQMARGYVDTMELAFDALDQGDSPDIARIEEMFEEAANVCFVASGVATAKTIERRLGLPVEFHRVLSPESVKTAHDAMKEGLNFFILRSDLNDDDEMAQGFFELITSGTVRMITNVTVFLDSRTLFDFLVATTMTEDELIERLAMLDSSGEKLSLINALRIKEDENGEAEDQAESIELAPIGDSADSLEILESIGAISASHAQVEQNMKSLATEDLMQDIQAALRAEGITQLDPRIRSILRERLDLHSLRLQEISESETQLSAQLSQLQQESVAHRSRPAEVLLRPLKAFVSTSSRKAGTEATLTYVGGDIELDQMLIEELRRTLKALVSLRLAANPQPTSFHVSLEGESDHIRVEVTDNGAQITHSPELEKIKEELSRSKGELRHVNLPAGGGVRFHLHVPLHMVVLDGMVVRVGDVRYVLPIDSIQRILKTDHSMPISAAKDQRILNLEQEGLVPIRNLLPANTNAEPSGGLYVILRSNERRIAIPVDELMGQQLVLLRPLQGVLSSVRDMSGVAILSGGEVGMVVAVSAIAEAS